MEKREFKIIKYSLDGVTPLWKAMEKQGDNWNTISETITAKCSVHCKELLIAYVNPPKEEIVETFTL